MKLHHKQHIASNARFLCIIASPHFCAGNGRYPLNQQFKPSWIFICRVQKWEIKALIMLSVEHGWEDEWHLLIETETGETGEQWGQVWVVSGGQDRITLGHTVSWSPVIPALWWEHCETHCAQVTLGHTVSWSVVLLLQHQSSVGVSVLILSSAHS